MLGEVSDVSDNRNSRPVTPKNGTAVIVNFAETDCLPSEPPGCKSKAADAAEEV